MSKKSIYHYKPLIEYLNELKRKKNEIWVIDVDCYTGENIPNILGVYAEIKGKLCKKGISHKTLVTKVMLGVFGCIPAFDTNFTSAFSDFAKGEVSFNNEDERSLGFIHDFYLANKASIDCLSNCLTTNDFETGNKTTFHYPKAKIIDMY